MAGRIARRIELVLISDRLDRKRRPADKLAITITPDLQSALNDYAALYAQAYGREEPVTELIPAMLTSFLESDRNFARARDDARKGRP